MVAETPLYLAVRNEQYDAITILLKNRAKADVVVFRVINTGDNVVLSRILPYIRLDALSDTLLHYATQYGRYDSCEVLIAHDADTNVADINGMTPLHMVISPVWSIQVDVLCNICDLLLDYMADPMTKFNGQTVIERVNATNNEDLSEVFRKYGYY